MSNSEDLKEKNKCLANTLKQLEDSFNEQKNILDMQKIEIIKEKEEVSTLRDQLEKVKAKAVNDLEEATKYWIWKTEFERQEVIRKAFIEKLLPQAKKVIIDKFHCLPRADIMFVMESNDWTFNNQVIDDGDCLYIGEVNKNNEPNGYGFILHKDKD